MNLTGPARVSENSSITVTASGFGEAYAIKFEVAGVSGNVGFNIKETRGAASVSYTESMSFAGSDRIDAFAQDEFGGVIARASHSFQVAGSTQARKAVRDADGPGNGGGYVLNVEAPQRTQINAEWRYRVSGLRDMHSLLVELYGANGGLFRLFPRGRDVMEHAFIPLAPGRTTVVLTGRDARLRPLVTLAGEIEVTPAGAVGGPGAGGGYEPLETFAPLPPLGLAKPPVAISARQALAQASASGGH
ncbi:MAG: hypothetical protein Q8R02_22285, partial [Hyphomonadaceae bacterium]|nr:hypothetical protein [Hyphomonadaceae bacterium]